MRRDHLVPFCICGAQDWDRQNPTQIVTEMCGFVTILSGTFLLHKTKDMADGGMPTFPSSFLPLWVIYMLRQIFSCVNVGLSMSSSFRLPTSSSVRFSKQTDEDGEGIPLRSSESFRSPH